MKTCIILFTALLFTVISCLSLYAQHPGSPFSDIVSGYYAVSNALIQGKPSAVTAQAKSFSAKITAAGSHQYSAAEEAALHQYLPRLQSNAGELQAAKDISRHREAFMDLSSAMIDLARTIKLSDKPVYIIYCPMKKAYWLSAESVVRNPYYGSAMLTCGSVKDRIQ